MSKANKPSAPITDCAATPAKDRRSAAAIRNTRKMLGKTARRVRAAGRDASKSCRGSFERVAEMVEYAAGALETPVSQAPATAPARKVTNWQSADDAIQALVEELADYGRANLTTREGKAVWEASQSLAQAAMSLRFAVQAAERGEPEKAKAESVTLLYGRWLAALGASYVLAETREDGEEGEPYDDPHHDTAWETAHRVFAAEATERWEVRYKVEVLRWLLDSGDIDRHPKERAFASIIADLEG